MGMKQKKDVKGIDVAHFTLGSEMFAQGGLFME